MPHHPTPRPADGPSRRGLLRVLAGMPLLPLASGVAATASLAACHGTAGDAPAAGLERIGFESMPAPSLADPQAMASTHVASSLVAHFTDGTRQRVALTHQALFVTGQAVPDGTGGTVIAGGCRDAQGLALVDRSVPGAERQFYSDSPDGSSLLRLESAAVPGVQGQAVFAVVQFEYITRDRAGASMYGRLPSPIAVLTLDQDPANGALRLVKYHDVDTLPARGLWITCGASLSPWNTHLASEEYEPDAALAEDPQLQAFSRHYFGDPAAARPYDYGHLPEVTVQPDGTGRIAKHYCTGRISHEVTQVMPDRRTALMGDDATHGGLFMFVADTEADLSAGTLYVAKWRQTSASGPGAGDLRWIRLGHASSAEVRAWVDAGIRCADIMDVRTTDPADPAYTAIFHNGQRNWVRLVPGMERAAAFLETRRYAALRGASMGFSKLEGTTVNAADKKAYSAVSSVTASMLKGHAANQGDIAVEGPMGGAVYEHTLAGGQVDLDGRSIASDWVSTRMAAIPALTSVMLPAADALGNLAHPDHVAGPDNLKFSEAMRTLFIGEDTGLHVNNFLWAWQVDTGELSRILSCPAGAESTGLHAVDALNGWTYVMSNFQHAGDWDAKSHRHVQPALDALVRERWNDRYGAAVGYLAAGAAHPRQA